MVSFYSEGEEDGSGDGIPFRRGSQPALAKDISPQGIGGTEGDPDRDMIILRYRGYLGIDVEVFHCDLAKLREGGEIGDRMMDFLIHHCHTVAHEAFRWRTTEVLIFPCAFTRGLLAIDEHESPVNLVRQLQDLHSQIERQRVLLVVINARLAISQSEPARSIHEVLPGHSNPDRAPFAILFLSSTSVLKSREVERIKLLVRQYLEVLWKSISGSILEFVDWVDVKSPGQDTISEGALHVVHNAEVLMRPGVADRLRQAHQRVYKMEMEEWHSIFNRPVMRRDFYRNHKVMVVEQEAQVWQIVS